MKNDGEEWYVVGFCIAVDVGHPLVFGTDCGHTGVRPKHGHAAFTSPLHIWIMKRPKFSGTGIDCDGNGG